MPSSAGPLADEAADLRAVRHPRATLAATILGSSLAFIDGSVVNVALPALGHDLHAGSSGLTWAINAYLLPLGALILLGGALGDHYGRRRLFLIGLALFTVATLLCAAAPSLPWLLSGRAVQGVGAALLMPNSLAILGATFAGEERGRAIGSWAAVGALAAALGPVIGGWLIDTIGWRTIFLLNVPIALAAGVLAFKYITESRDTESRGADSRGTESSERGSPAPLDTAGAGLATLALGLLTWSLTEASNPAGSSLSGPAALLGCALLGGFVWHEKSRGERALMPLQMFSSASFIGLTLLTFFLYGSLGGLLVLLPYFLISIEHWSAVAAGAALLPVPIIIGVSSRAMGRVAARYGGKLPLSIGSAVVAMGLALYARIGAAGLNYWSDVLPATLLVAAGMGACVAPLTTSVMASVDTDHVGIASGFNSAVARIAGLIATAALGFVLVRQQSTEEFISGFRAAAWVGGASALLAAAFGFWLIPSTHANAEP